eukprot:CAMPEP_0167743406 /NCGR_PEP_ID=MMETSP0110_2-20121227/2000_1 /TAXON_ID=629695 /ORGANISM="Gymnochlora sp., Strain CCMP2014" /LENGTH=41 /DNA_ID= /DNA_START= /DNA_END= /DNA_ORIENTATION=
MEESEDHRQSNHCECDNDLPSIPLRGNISYLPAHVKYEVFS